MKTIEDIIFTYYKSPKKWNFINSFKSVLFEKYSEYKLIFYELNQADADYINISGSGSSVFGIFSNKNKIKKAYMLETNPTLSLILERYSSLTNLILLFKLTRF